MQLHGITSTGNISTTATVSAATGSFNKQNGRAVEIYQGSTLKAYWTGTGEVHATRFIQNGSNNSNTFIGAIETTSSLKVATTSQFQGTVKVGSGTTGAVQLTTAGTVSATQVTADSILGDKLQVTNLTGLSEFPGTPTLGAIAMFQGVLYYYGSGNAWYRFNVTQSNPPA